MTDTVLEHLANLVAFDSQNPPRDLDGDGPLFTWLRSQLPGFEVRVTDHGEGHVTFFAQRGTPRTLFNVHLDTVPVGEGWESDPLELRVSDGRAYGRGACDIKGAAAVLLDLAQSTDHDLALLFTTDEEGAGGCCVQRFCESGQLDPFDLVVVAEPTCCQAVTAHRGYLSVTGRFSGEAGHSSDPRGLAENALHGFARWAGAALAHVGESAPHSRFNLGRVEGGIKSNVIADRVDVAWSARLPPGTDSQAFLDSVLQTPPGEQASWKVPFLGPSLPAGDADNQALAQRLGELDLPAGEPVDFWTEASLFSAAGKPAFVLGPGDIAQAHTTDEWVALDELARARTLYLRLMEAHG